MSSKKRVLVVDDDDAIRTLVERILRRERFHVESACDGSEAIDKLGTAQYDAVLLDLMMPRVDGHGVIRFLEREKSPPVPQVIVMTANMHGANEVRSAAPVTDVIPKPFDISELLSHVHACRSAVPEGDVAGGLDEEAVAS